VTPGADARRAELLLRLDAVGVRLHALATQPEANGAQTDADPETGERWDSGQVWAHLAEIGPFWLGEASRVVDAPDAAEPPTFGRTMASMAGRARAVRRGRGAGREPYTDAVLATVADARGRLVQWTHADLARPARNDDMGVVDVATIIDVLLVAHYEEHAAQLEQLVASTPMDARAEALTTRLDAAVVRLRIHSVAPQYRGLTAPDPPTGEQWDAGQVWAHLGEIGGYWLRELDHVVDAASDDPVPFGRTKKDAGRIAAIESGRTGAPTEHMVRVEDAAAGLRDRMARYSDEDWSRVCRHETLGDMDVEKLIDEFIVGHYEQHADQLDSLA
jgi:hypothetical protein